jgi:hypothetical protein
VSSGKNLYWLADGFEAPYGQINSCILRRVSLEGGEVEAVGACGNPELDSLAAIGGDLYWIDGGGWALFFQGDSGVERLVGADRAPGFAPPFKSYAPWDPPVVGDPVFDGPAGATLEVAGGRLFWASGDAVLALGF